MNRTSTLKLAAYRDFRANSGFTLVELMVVMIIMTLFSVAIAPSAVSAMRHKNIQAEGEKLAELLRFANVNAIARGHAIQVNLDSRRGLCWATRLPVSLPWLENPTEARTETLGVLRLPEGIQMEVFRDRAVPWASSGGDWDRILFSSNGQAESAIVLLRDLQENTFTIEVAGVSGEVFIRDEPIP